MAYLVHRHQTEMKERWNLLGDLQLVEVVGAIRCTGCTASRSIGDTGIEQWQSMDDKMEHPDGTNHAS